LDAHHQSAQSSHYPLDPSINLTPQFLKDNTHMWQRGRATGGYQKKSSTGKNKITWISVEEEVEGFGGIEGDEEAAIAVVEWLVTRSLSTTTTPNALSCLATSSWVPLA
jgi:hypothetical protein